MPAADVRKISFIACVFFVLLRFSIGWQFLYEGMWKYQSQFTARQWTATGYLANAQGPLRDHFRNQVEDPDDLNKLDYDKVAARWDDWLNRFYAKFPAVKEHGGFANFEKLVNGPEPKQWSVELKLMPKTVEFRGSLGNMLTYDAENKRLITNEHLTARDRDALQKLVTVVQNPTPEQKRDFDIARRYQAAVKKLYEASATLSLKEQLAILLKYDVGRVGVVRTEENFKPFENVVGTLDEEVIGEIKLYEKALAEYDKRSRNPQMQDFRYAHLSKQWSEIQQKRAELIGPVDALSVRLTTEAEKLLPPGTASRGAVVMHPSKTADIDRATIYALVGIGALLMLGLFSRLAALGATGLLMLFYLAMPPLPGLPAAPGPEHSLIVNKNLIEAVACLALVAVPSGRWFGLDGLIHRFVFRKKD